MRLYNSACFLNYKSLMNNSKQDKKALNSIYLKQFFGRFFERKQMMESISSFKTGLDVLETVLSKFQTKLDIRPNKKLAKNCGHFSNDIEREASIINSNIQNVYNRLEVIYESWKQKPQNLSESYVEMQDKKLFGQCDDELYQMLNKYQRDCKKEKELRLKGQRTIRALNQTIQTIQEEKRILNEKFQNNQFHLQSVIKQNQGFQKHIKQLKEELSVLQKESTEMRVKMDESYLIEEELGKIKKQSSILDLRLKQSEQNMKLQKQKFKALDQVVKAKIEEKAQHWQQLVDKKLKQKQLYEAPACRVLKSLMKTLNKQNFPHSNKQ